MLLNLVLIIYVFLQSHILVNIIKSPLSFINSFLFTFSLILLYLDDFKLSNIKFIKYIQMFSFVCIPLYIGYYIYNIPYIFVLDIITYAKDNNDINLHGHVNLDKEAGKAISQGMNTIGNNIGLGASIAGLGSAVAKGIAKSSIPPLQKAIIIASGATIGGMIHTGASYINKNNALEEYSKSVSNITNHISDSSVNKFLGGISSNISPLEGLLLSIQIINYACLSLVFILTIQLLFKFIIKDNIKFDISKIIGTNLNGKFNYYLNKIIILNKKMNNIYI
jgi:hypothetical protein